MNYASALIGVYVCFMVAINAEAIRGIEGIRGDILCGFFGALLYYFVLVYFMWTGFQAVDLYRKLVRVLNTENKHFVLYGGLLCWGKYYIHPTDVENQLLYVSYTHVGIPFVIAVVASVAGRDDYIEYEYL